MWIFVVFYGINVAYTPTRKERYMDVEEEAPRGSREVPYASMEPRVELELTGKDENGKAIIVKVELLLGPAKSLRVVRILDESLDQAVMTVFDSRVPAKSLKNALHVYKSRSRISLGDRVCLRGQTRLITFVVTSIKVTVPK